MKIKYAFLFIFFSIIQIKTSQPSLTSQKENIADPYAVILEINIHISKYEYDKAVEKLSILIDQSEKRKYADADLYENDLIKLYSLFFFADILEKNKQYRESINTSQKAIKIINKNYKEENDAITYLKIKLKTLVGKNLASEGDFEKSSEVFLSQIKYISENTDIHRNSNFALSFINNFSGLLHSKYKLKEKHLCGADANTIEAIYAIHNEKDDVTSIFASYLIIDSEICLSENNKTAAINSANKGASLIKSLYKKYPENKYLESEIEKADEIIDQKIN